MSLNTPLSERIACVVVGLFGTRIVGFSGFILHAAKNDTNPKRKRGPQLVTSFALRVSMNRLISGRGKYKLPSQVFQMGNLTPAGRGRFEPPTRGIDSLLAYGIMGLRRALSLRAFGR